MWQIAFLATKSYALSHKLDLWLSTGFYYVNHCTLWLSGFQKSYLDENVLAVRKYVSIYLLIYLFIRLWLHVQFLHFLHTAILDYVWGL